METTSTAPAQPPASRAPALGRARPASLPRRARLAAPKAAPGGGDLETARQITGDRAGAAPAVSRRAGLLAAILAAAPLPAAAQQLTGDYDEGSYNGYVGYSDDGWEAAPSYDMRRPATPKPPPPPQEEAWAPSRGEDVLRRVESVEQRYAEPAPAAAPEEEAPMEGDVRTVIRRAFDRTAGKAKAPVLLRLAFHDAGTFSLSSGGGGANGSVRFELKRPENQGLLRGWKIIDATMAALRGSAADGLVTYADLIALGGAYAVHVTGGPDIEIPIGRPDAASADPEARLPDERASADQLLHAFADKGFSPQEFVALSGAHTLGNKGFGDPVTFDNAYYAALQQRPWANPDDNMASMIGLPSDHVLPDHPECQPAIRRYATSQDAFFHDFAAAYTKLSALGTSLI